MPVFKFPNPFIMGILNITPDSFYDGGKYENSDEISLQVEKLVSEGAHIIDVGAESTRPGSKKISYEVEIDRLTKVVTVIGKFPNIYFSIDTSKTQVAEFALSNGFNMINDITGGGTKGEMFKIAAKYNVPIVIMHMLGTPETMQNNPEYNDLVIDLISYFKSRIKLAKSIGLSEKNIIIDPGIGFGKHLEDNFEIINSLDRFVELGYPVHIGASRKSFLRVDDDMPSDRLGASISAAIASVKNGASIVRVHDVAQTIKSLFITNKFKFSS